MNALVRSVPAAAHVIDYASRLVVSLHPETAGATDQVKRFVRLGPSPRGAQALALAGRVAALMEGRHNLSIDDIQAIALPALRHRLVLSIDAERQNVSPGRDRPGRDRGAAAGARPAAPTLAIDAAELRQLETLSLAGVEAVVAGFGGQRSGAQRTRGLEFVDYRRYTPGDDLRSIDWNVYARLREIVVKAAPAEGHVDLALLLDGSRSMDDGAPSRFRYAQELGAMLGTVALLGSDVVAVHMLADGTSFTGARLAAPHLVTRADRRGRGAAARDADRPRRQPARVPPRRRARRPRGAPHRRPRRARRARRSGRRALRLRPRRRPRPPGRERGRPRRARGRLRAGGPRDRRAPRGRGHPPGPRHLRRARPLRLDRPEGPLRRPRRHLPARPHRRRPDRPPLRRRPRRPRSSASRLAPTPRLGRGGDEEAEADASLRAVGARHGRAGRADRRVSRPPRAAKA